jgi:hypothetical protein
MFDFVFLSIMNSSFATHVGTSISSGGPQQQQQQYQEHQRQQAAGSNNSGRERALRQPIV